MALNNQAALLLKASEKLQVESSVVGKPGPGEVLIQNHAAAINPVDFMVQDNLFPPQQLPTVLGNDIAGEVIEAGENTGFSKGQRVIAHCQGLRTGKPEHGGFQNFTLAPAISVCPIPEHVSYEEAVVLPLALSTAAIGLYEKTKLNLPKPSHKVNHSGQALLVWGGSSSVGSTVIQLAVASGLTVIATASQKNSDYCKSLGASEVFDYNSTSIVDDLTTALQKYQLAGAFDAIGQRATQLKVANVVDRLGGGNVAVVLPPIEDGPATVHFKDILAFTIFADAPDVCQAIYRDFLPGALESGQVRPAPKPEVVGHGLDFVQTALDKMREGVSAKKLVVTL